MAADKKRTVIVTGANCGLGFRASEVLAERGYRVILACRNEDRAREAVEKIRKTNPNADVEYQIMDLADLSSVEKFSQWFISRDEPLHALVNNAGLVPADGQRRTTQQGFEMTFGVNHLGHFLLTMLLLDKLKSTATQQGQSRIVTVSSVGHNPQHPDMKNVSLKPIDLQDLNAEKMDPFIAFQAYKNSKAANVMFTYVLSRGLEGTGVVANTMCPGFIPSTSIFRNYSFMMRILLKAIDNAIGRYLFKVRSVDYGADHIVRLVDDEEFKTQSGIFYKDHRIAETSEEVRDQTNQKTLWMKSCEFLQREEFKSFL